jgi:hypothetical protein
MKVPSLQQATPFSQIIHISSVGNMLLSVSLAKQTKTIHLIKVDLIADFLVSGQGMQYYHALLGRTQNSIVDDEARF